MVLVNALNFVVILWLGVVSWPMFFGLVKDLFRVWIQTHILICILSVAKIGYAWPLFV